MPICSWVAFCHYILHRKPNHLCVTSWCDDLEKLLLNNSNHMLSNPVPDSPWQLLSDLVCTTCGGGGVYVSIHGVRISLLLPCCLSHHCSLCLQISGCNYDLFHEGRTLLPLLNKKLQIKRFYTATYTGSVT